MGKRGPSAPMCNGCGLHPLTKEFDSEAHIIPNALGGRLAPKGLICRECNTLLDQIADNPLIRAFGPWPTLIDVPRHRDSNPPVQIDTTDGQRIRVEADGSRTRSDLVYDVKPLEDREGHTVSIGAYNMKVMKQLIGKAAKQFAQLDPSVAAAHAKSVETQPKGEWRIQTNFGPANVFPGAFVAFWLFFLHKTGYQLATWDRVLQIAQDMQKGGTFRYIFDGLPGLDGPTIPVSHKIVLRNVPSTGDLIGYLEVLGTLRIGGLLAQGAPGSPLLEHIYALDVFGKKDRSSEFGIDSAKFDSVDWRKIGLGLESVEELRTRLQDAQLPLQERWAEREAQLTSKG